MPVNDAYGAYKIYKYPIDGTAYRCTINLYAFAEAFSVISALLAGATGS